jgi:hypothetical protein
VFVHSFFRLFVPLFVRSNSVGADWEGVTSHSQAVLRPKFPMATDTPDFLNNLTLLQFAYKSPSCLSHNFDIHTSLHRNIITNYIQQDATFLEFISTGAVYVSGCSSTHHQEHITIHTASGIVNQYCC